MDVTINTSSWTDDQKQRLTKIAETLTIASTTEDRISRECMMITQLEALQRLMADLFSGYSGARR